MLDGGGGVGRRPWQWPTCQRAAVVEGKRESAPEPGWAEGLSEGARRVAPGRVGQAPSHVCLEEAQLLRRVRDQQVLRLLVVQQLYPR